MSFSAIDNYNTISRASFFWGRLEDGLPPAFTSESLAGHLARLGDYFARFKGGSGKSWWKSWYWRWRGVPDVGAIRRSLEGDPAGGSKYRVVWRPQRDENPNGIPAEFAIALGRSSPPVKRGRKHSASSGRKRSKG